MINRKIRYVIVAAVMMLVASVAAIVSSAEIPDDIVNPFAAAETGMKFDVAEDGNRFAFLGENLHEDGMPDYGTPFMTRGYIYPAGTLDGSNGVLDNGEPEFPDLVLGTWTCYGWMIADGMHTSSGEALVSTQVFQFTDGDTIVTDGFEIVDTDVPYTRAISGGSGKYVGITGEQVQTLLGFTDQMGVNLRVSFNLLEELVAVTDTSK